MRLGVFWFGIQVVWTALLGVVLQERASVLAHDPVTLFSWLVGIGAVVASVVQILAGIFSDRRRARTGDRRAFYAWGVGLAVPAIVVLPFAGSTLVLWCAALLLQLGMNLAGGPYQGIVGDYVEPERIGRASSWMSVFQFLGSVAGALLTALLHGPALGAALAFALAASWLATDRYVADLPRAFEAPKPLRLDANVRTVLVSRALINVGFYTLFYYLFFFVHDALRIADARTVTAYLFLAFTVAGVGGAALAGRAADRYDKRAVVSVACVAIALAVGTFAAAPNAGVAFACAIGAGLAWGAFFTADWAIAYAVLPRTALASAMGVWNLAATVPQLIAPAITGVLVARIDPHGAGIGARIALVLVVVEFVLGTAWLWRLRLPAIGARETRSAYGA
jgi:MFS family permease